MTLTISCDDGFCYHQILTHERPMRNVESACIFYLKQCALDCTDDKNCAAFSFSIAEKSGNDSDQAIDYSYECRLMDNLNCPARIS